jgi:hypothetical protein
MEEKYSSLEDKKHIVKDVLQGDNTIDNKLFSNNFSNEEIEKVRSAYKLIINNPNISESKKQDFLLNSWKVFNKSKPPTIREFLTEKWIGPTAKDIFPHVREILYNFFEGDKRLAQNLLLCMAIGTGKSFTSTVVSLFVTAQLWCMKNPKMYFKNVSTATSIVHMLVSFTMDKAKQLLMDPFMNIIRQSPKFKQVKFQERINSVQEENPDNIVWSTASNIGVMQFSNDIHYVLASDPANLLGMTVIGGIMSELSFFIDKGFSAEYISRIYNDVKGRVNSRFKNDYLSYTVLDSSPNDMVTSPLDKYVFSGEAEKDQKNYVVRGSQWEFIPHNYPEWQKTGKTFSVFRGNSKNPPSIIRSDYERQQYSIEEIIEVPDDPVLVNQFEQDLLKSIKDFCGWPAGAEDKLFRDYDKLEEMFTPFLKNIYSYVYAPSNKPSEGMIWNHVKQFFTKISSTKYEFSRAPNEKRYIHVDQAKSKDSAGISCVHPELDDQSGKIIWVTDFTLSIHPGKHKINLDAIRVFPEDLKKNGNVNIELITFDGFQSMATMDYLKLQGFNVKKLSVDIDTKPYYFYVSKIQTGEVKCGKNIILKNNIKSLKEVTSSRSGKRKIDHDLGKLVHDDGGDWKLSMMGMNAKDLSDSHCGAIYNGIIDFAGIPKYRWDSKLEEEILNDSSLTEEEKVSTHIERVTKSKIYDKWGLYY